MLYLAPEDGTKVNVVCALKRAWLAHLAAHGWYNVDDPMSSFLLLADDGLATNGDSRLSLYEAIHGNLHLTGLRLLVLSACETAISDVLFAPDEAIGIASGFLQAGAAGVIASLWAVDDEASYLLMARFFQLYLDPLTAYTPSQALAAAQKWLREEATNRVLAAFDPLRPMHDVQSGASRGGERTLVTPTNSAETDNFPVIVAPRSLRAAVSPNTMADIRASAVSRAEDGPDELPFREPIFWASYSLTGCWLRISLCSELSFRITDLHPRKECSEKRPAMLLLMRRSPPLATSRTSPASLQVMEVEAAALLRSPRSHTNAADSS